MKPKVAGVAGYGVPGLRKLAPRFGIKPESLERFAHRHDVQWQQRSREGLADMARTWETMRYWGYSLKEIGEAFDYKPSSIRATICRKVDSEYEPPIDPTDPAKNPLATR